jgi:hypothetical protein
VTLADVVDRIQALGVSDPWRVRWIRPDYVEMTKLNMRLLLYESPRERSGTISCRGSDSVFLGKSTMDMLAIVREWQSEEQSRCDQEFENTMQAAADAITSIREIDTDHLAEIIRAMKASRKKAGALEEIRWLEAVLACRIAVAPSTGGAGQEDQG